MKRPERRPLAVMMSKRANMFYLEHVRLMQKDGRVMYLTETRQPIEQLINIPDKNTSVILLGKGSSITDSAMRMLAESNVTVGFCGSGGTPLHGIVDPIFISPQDEYRPTEYMQDWARMWFDEASRLEAGKHLLRHRIALMRQHYAKITEFSLPEALLNVFAESIDAATEVTFLLTAEARYAKSLYGILASHFSIPFTREPGMKSRESKKDIVNSYLDHGNYLAYGLSAVALHTMGISYAFPVLHGKTRRGALVFDIADLIKDWIVMPAAFQAAASKKSEQEFRGLVIYRSQQYQVLDLLMDFIKEVSKKSNVNHGLEESQKNEG